MAFRIRSRETCAIRCMIPARTTDGVSPVRSMMNKMMPMLMKARAFGGIRNRFSPVPASVTRTEKCVPLTTSR